MDGILLVNKPKNWTSHDVVAKIRGILKSNSPAGRDGKIKVGHTGTLDPLASGLLVIVIGDYTKKANTFSKLDKAYDVSLKLGQTSTTGDEEGSKTVFKNKQPTIHKVNKVLNQFIGEIEQIPPAYSALKVKGQRSYKLARSGESVKLEPRKITIYDMQNVEYDYPKLSFTAKVSSGTYIRSLASDIGEKLGTGAYLSDLRRIKVGKFNLSAAYQLDEISVDKISISMI